jgi:hypothetical protein
VAARSDVPAERARHVPAANRGAALARLTLPIAQGRSEAMLGIPVSASLLNTVVRHQLVGIELGASAVITEATTSDAVALTIGAQ